METLTTKVFFSHSMKDFHSTFSLHVALQSSKEDSPAALYHLGSNMKTCYFQNLFIASLRKVQKNFALGDQQCPLWCFWINFQLLKTKVGLYLEVKIDIYIWYLWNLWTSERKGMQGSCYYALSELVFKCYLSFSLRKLS